MIFFDEASLQSAVLEFLAHNQAEQNHQGLENRLRLADLNWREANDRHLSVSG
jgi:hypothetical protein